MCCVNGNFICRTQMYYFEVEFISWCIRTFPGFLFSPWKPFQIMQQKMETTRQENNCIFLKCFFFILLMPYRFFLISEYLVYFQFICKYLVYIFTFIQVVLPRRILIVCILLTMKFFIYYIIISIIISKRLYLIQWKKKTCIIFYSVSVKKEIKRKFCANWPQLQDAEKIRIFVWKIFFEVIQPVAWIKTWKIVEQWPKF